MEPRPAFSATSAVGTLRGGGNSILAGGGACGTAAWSPARLAVIGR